MAQRHQRGWLKKEKRSEGETWMLFFRPLRESDGKRVESKVAIGLVQDFHKPYAGLLLATLSYCQLRVFRLRLLKDGDVRVGVVPEGEEILIRRPSFGGFALQNVGAGEAEMS